jgi:hypothetical protein
MRYPLGAPTGTYLPDFRALTHMGRLIMPTWWLKGRPVWRALRLGARATRARTAAGETRGRDPRPSYETLLRNFETYQDRLVHFTCELIIPLDLDRTSGDGGVSRPLQPTTPLARSSPLRPAPRPPAARANR